MMFFDVADSFHFLQMTNTINLLGVILWCTVLTHSLIVPLVVPISTTCHNNGCQHVPSSTIIEGPFLLAALNGKSVETTKGFYPDKVILLPRTFINRRYELCKSDWMTGCSNPLETFLSSIIVCIVF